MNGFILYEGPSKLTGEPIVAIVTGLEQKSRNKKTGPMCQGWIIRSDISPTEAVSTGLDRAICGDCQHRSPHGHIGRSCYVIWWQGPMQVWKAYKRGEYSHRAGWENLSDEMLGRHVRIGAYGDPAAVPYRNWLNVIRFAGGWIGYTQQWRTCDPMFSRIIMASVQSVDEQLEAKAAGWRTYRCRPVNGMILEDEVICPASDEGGHAATCQQCQLCGGTDREAKSVVIEVHGQRAKWFTKPIQEGWHGDNQTEADRGARRSDSAWLTQSQDRTDA